MKIASGFNLFAFVSIFAILTACTPHEQLRGFGGLIIGDTMYFDALDQIQPGVNTSSGFQKGFWGTYMDSRRKALQSQGYMQYYTEYQVEFAGLEVQSIEALFKDDLLIALRLEPGFELEADVLASMRNKYGPGSRVVVVGQSKPAIQWRQRDIILYYYPRDGYKAGCYMIFDRSAFKAFRYATAGDLL